MPVAHEVEKNDMGSGKLIPLWKKAMAHRDISLLRYLQLWQAISGGFHIE
jgi:hypothetical protein